ncbi:hypothetical protein GEV29_13675 [Aeromicrobium sp. SMF47]|uniref:hypothetical protein n=1 Tax=Aeromicrobium yanjiei TaxID=2662028 RepID=UPI00129D4481|nr:hypothetical protein [Aeromicrobium yanjiei]MRJ77590.1 hypothetical protein [Aeromicrobium yanjiei]
MVVQRKTKDELLELYSDDPWRSSVSEISRLVEFLSDCVLSEKYKIPDSISKVVHLTEHGNRVMQRLITKNQVPAKEARLLCLLRMFHLEPLIDFAATDVEQLRVFIDSQVKDRSLLYPFILGRDLYDKAAELFEETREVLSHRDTLELLSDMPVGVFQSGPFVSGPYGLVRSTESRWFGPTTLVPMYHCAELTCGRIHRTRLSTDHLSPINEHLATLDKILDQVGEDESEWGEFVNALDELDGLRFDDTSDEPVFLALADLLGDGELRILLAELMDSTSGRLRQDLSKFDLGGRADDVVAGLDRAALLQCLLLARNEDIVSTLDRLIRQPNSSDGLRNIDVPSGEVRRLRTNQGMSYGTFGIYPEISQYGIRFVSSDVQLAPMRLSRLAESLYLLGQHDEIDELQWQLRNIDGEDPKEQLDEFLRTSEPEDVVRKLVLARRTNQIATSEKLGVGFGAADDDDTFVAAVLWKLGFYNRRLEDRNRTFWSHHQRLKRYVQTAGVGARIDAEDLRSRAINYFVELEGVLDDALAFSAWALTTDHVAAQQPFTYNVDRDRNPIFERMNEFEQSREGEAESPKLTDKNTLYPLIYGFGTLADWIENIEEDRTSHQRPSAEYPRFVQHTDLKKFPFHHCIPVLDLLPGSRDRIVESLRFVRRSLAAGEVPNIRNDYTHYRHASDLPKLDSLIDGAEKALNRLESDGLCRLTFSLVSDEGDAWGRRVYVLSNARARQLTFSRPSEFDWNRMPRLRSPQYVLPAAAFARPNEFLRFSPAFSTAYAQYWENYPKRRLPRMATSQSSGEAFVSEVV